MLTSFGAVTAVETMIEQKDTFEQIETFIETLLIPAEVKSLLWLLAWAEAEPGERREVITSLLPT